MPRHYTRTLPGQPTLNLNEIYGDDEDLDEVYADKLRRQEDLLKQEQEAEAASYKAFVDDLPKDDKSPMDKANKNKSGHRLGKEAREKRKQSQELLKELENSHSGGTPDSGTIASGGGNRNKHKGGRLGKKQTEKNRDKFNDTKPSEPLGEPIQKDPLQIKREGDNNLLYLTVGIAVLFIAFQFAS